MSLFYVSIYKKNVTNNDKPYWETSIDAFDVEEAYEIGKDQFVTENTDNNLEDFIVKASGYQLEK